MASCLAGDIAPLERDAHKICCHNKTAGGEIPAYPVVQAVLENAAGTINIDHIWDLRAEWRKATAPPPPKPKPEPEPKPKPEPEPEIKRNRPKPTLKQAQIRSNSRRLTK